MKKVINIIGKAILVFLLLILIYVSYSKYILKRKITTLGGYGVLVVLTGSMKPEIEDGELIVIKKEDNYFIGDIVTYENGNSLITHRIIENEGKIITQGDYNNERDLPINSNQIVGKVVYHSKILGTFVTKYLKIVLTILIFIGILIFGCTFIGEKKERAELNGEQEEEKQ